MEDLENADLETLESMLLAEQKKASNLEEAHKKLELEVQKIAIKIEQKEEYLIAVFNKKIKKLKEHNASASLIIQKEESIINKLDQQYQASTKQSVKLAKTISTHEDQICPELEEQIKLLSEEIVRVRNSQPQKEEAESLMTKIKSDLEKRRAICENQLCDFTNEIEDLIRYNNCILEQIGQDQTEQANNDSAPTENGPYFVARKHHQGYSSLPVKRKKRKVHHTS